MKKVTIVLGGLLSLLALSTGVRADRPPRTILSFTTMYGVDGPFVGADNAIRGIPGDELPWRIAGTVKGRLATNGNLSITVRGLVFTDDPEVPPELRGTNDESEFRALVSCLSEDGNQVVTKNVTTQGFPATPSGNSNIETRIELPESCVAPIVFILAGSEDKWFAVTGAELGG
jgi:hypothetical protein